MRTAARGATYFVAACLLSGCGSSPAVRQAKQTDPIIVVTVQSTPKTKADKPTATKADAAEKNLKLLESSGLVGVLKATDPDDAQGVFGGVVGGVLGAPGQGFGGLGLSGSGISGGTGSGFGIGGMLGRVQRPRAFEVHGRSGDRVKAKVGNVVVTGPLLVDIVQRHVDEHREDFQTCHDLASRSVSSWGSVTFRLQIDATGHVVDVQVYETTLSASPHDLENCLGHAIGAFQFPPASANAPVTILLPISF